MNQNMKQNIISHSWDAQTRLARNLTGYNVPSPALSEDLVGILGKAHEGIYDYPLSFTQGIVPKQIYSHNDYWRDVPLYSAISVGCLGFETDVWLFDGRLYVGHNPSALTRERTLEALYIRPLVDILTRQNPKSEFVKTPTRHGIYDKWLSRSVHLVIDLKNERTAIWSKIVEALEPLREKNWLSTVENGKFVSGPITVVCTGKNLPAELLHEDDFKGRPRDLFIEAPLHELDTVFANVPATVAPLVNAQFSALFGAKPISSTGLNAAQKEILNQTVHKAHARGMIIRIWDTPAWPTCTRDSVWRNLIEADVDLLNVDEIREAAGLTSDW